jgi:hypothetical protein
VCKRVLWGVGNTGEWFNDESSEGVISGDDLGGMNVKKDVLDPLGVIFGEYNLEALIIISRTDSPQLKLALCHAFSRSFAKIIVISLYFVE